MRKLYPTWAALAFLTLFGLRAQAQEVANYSFSARDTAWAFHAPDSSLIDGGLPNDDNVYRDISLGFTFPFRGNNYGSIHATTNGVIAFEPNDGLFGLFNTGNGVAFTSDNTDILAFLNADLTASADANSEVGIRRGTQNGQKFFSLIFQRMRRYDNNGAGNAGFAGDSISLQVYLWESGRISVVYGPSIIDARESRTIQVGLKGADTTDVLPIRGSFAAPVAGTGATTTLTLSSTSVWRSAGRVFTFSPPIPTPNDVAVRNLTLVGLNNPLCGGSATQAIQGTLVNLGSSPVSSASVGYRINGGAIVRQTVNFSPALGQYARQTVTFTGGQSANLAAFGRYDIKIFSELAADANHANDTSASVINLGPDLTLPSGVRYTTYNEVQNGGWRRAQGPGGRRPYTGFSIGEFNDNGNSTTEVFFSAFTDTTNVWFIRDGILNSNATPKSIGFTLAMGNPLFNGGIDPLSTIDDDDSLNVLISTDCGSHWRILRSFTKADVDNGDVDNTYRNYIEPLTGIAPNQTISIAFQVTAGNTAATSSYSWLLDNLRFPNPVDAGVDSVFIPGTTFAGCGLSNQQTIGVRVGNYGSSALSSILVGYQVNNLSPVTRQVSLSLAPGADTVIAFTGAQGANLSANGSYAIRGFATATGDPAQDNDSTLRSLTLGAGLDALPALGTTFGSISELQTAGFIRYSGTPSGLAPVQGNVFNAGFPIGETIALSVNTQAQIHDWLLRPKYQLTGSDVGLSFSLMATTGTFSTGSVDDIGDDTLYVVASNDCGATWNKLRKFSQADIASGTVDNTLRTFRVGIPYRTGSLVIGWYFNNNNTPFANGYAWHIDSVRFGAGADIAAVEIGGVKPFLGYCLGQTVPVSIKYFNNGFNTVDSVQIAYQANNATPVTQTVRRRLAPGQTDSAIFNVPVLISSRGNVHIRVRATVPGDASAVNDTIGATTRIGRASTIPTIPYGNFAALTAAGFATGSGVNGTAPGGFIASTSYGGTNPTSTATILNTATGLEKYWLISPLYAGQAAGGVNLRFRLSASAGATTTNPNPAVGADDSLSIYYRISCGPWQFVKAYTQQDFTNRVLSNALTQQIVGIGAIAATDSFQIAFVATNGGTAPTAAYRWHINSLFVSDQTATRPALQTLGLLLFPNPTTGQVYIQGVKGQATATLQDLQGRTVLSAKLVGDEAPLSLNGVAPGTYLIWVETSEGRAAQRLVVQ